MKVIIFGANGMLGTYLTSYLGDKYDIVPLTRKDWDLTKINDPEFNGFIEGLNITESDVIINAAGIIKQRETDDKEMFTVNTLFPHKLADIKDRYGCEVIHISTDCVYDGETGGYTESDPHTCDDIYGKSKSMGENPFLTIIRTSIIGEELSNKKSLLEWVKSNEGKTINGYTTHLWNGVTCLELSKYIHSIIENNEYWHGVKHIFSPSVTTKYDLVDNINHIYDLNITVNSLDPKPHIHRDLSSHEPTPIKTSLYKQIQELKEYNINERNTKT